MKNDDRLFSKISNLRSSISSYQEFCDGYGNNHVSGNSYVLGTVLATSKTEQKLSHNGSSNLDFINAFDKAEVADTNIGKINMINVSSFCGPQGLILGYDILQSKIIEKYKLDYPKYKNLTIYSLDPLLIATKAILGSVDDPIFPIIPGAHVPCAGKHIEAKGPCILYAALALGISKKGSIQDTLLMEDSGYIIDTDEEKIIENLINSVLEVGINQKTEYKTIFVGIKSVKVEDGMVGCALVSAPYLLLPKDSVESPENFVSLNLEQWIEKFHHKVN